MAESSFPSYIPSLVSNVFASSLPTILPATPDPITFFAIGDVPYYQEQAENLTYQMLNIPSSADFVIHVGDMRNSTIKDHCDRDEYKDVAKILRLSPVPVFILLGDNDWPDCSNAEDGYGYWKDEFLNFESKWDHNFDITRQPEVEENFAFVHKGSLFMGLNMVGRNALGNDAWEARMTDQANWVIQSVRDYREETLAGMGRVFLFGHAIPGGKHDNFFLPLKEFVRDELKNSIPILYLHGDMHEWLYAPNFLNQESFLEIMVTGGSEEPPLKFVINADGYYADDYPDTEKAFPFFRDLKNAAAWNTPPSERN